MNYAALQLSWTDSIVTSDITAVPDPCGALTHDITDASAAVLSSYSNIFPSYDLASASKTLDVATTNFADAMAYPLILNVYYTSYPANVHSKNFKIEVIDYCAPTTVNT